MTTAVDTASRNRRAIAMLLISNLLGGVGVASGVAVGALLTERLGGASVAGFGQAASVLGAAVAAVPLARIAARHGRRRSLALGYALATVGALTILTAAVVDQLILLLLGLGLFGVAQAVNLQSRYAAGENAPAATRGRTMAIVIWATTIGSVAGPNLSEPGDRVGIAAGLPELAGPYLFSLVAFALAGLALAIGYPRLTRPTAEPTFPGEVTSALAPVGALAALRWASRSAVPRFAVVLTASAHAVMVMIMVMTPLHLQHHGMSLTVVGVVISLHILGMFGLSPVFGWCADRFGAVRTAGGGMVLLVVAIVLGLVAAGTGGGGVLTAVALTVLGLGWSGCVIAASALLASTEEHVRVPLQGATDAGMNVAGAVAAALAGTILAWGGFTAVNLAGAVLLVPAVVLLLPAVRIAPAAPAAPPAR
ncbi:MFS transporter [Ruania alba]|uniref:Predicted arabinose efflux permease, MFS family n=1 Tax=Ruania alba TaxID=648782 RepID=A0A1H5ND03_9MICO|nr:MFS transporter [Ruania alba]SEE98747.1 Predicted arabinose efflux permease, MFS family [Ruania alba]